MQILYFAWVREKIGRSSEEITLPADVRDVGGLMRHLAALTPGHAAAFANPALIRAAINQDFARADDLVTNGDEVAFFSPVTRG